jgi:hypothetical protein
MNATPGTVRDPSDYLTDVLVSLDDLAAGVVAAVRADAVGLPGSATLRAGLELHQPEREVRASPSLAALGELDLR